MFLNVIYFCEGKAELLSAITSVFSVTWSLRNYLMLKKHFLLLSSMFKVAVYVQLK